MYKKIYSAIFFVTRPIRLWINTKRTERRNKKAFKKVIKNFRDYDYTFTLEVMKVCFEEMLTGIEQSPIKDDKNIMSSLRTCIFLLIRLSNEECYYNKFDIKIHKLFKDPKTETTRVKMEYVPLYDFPINHFHDKHSPWKQKEQDFHYLLKLLRKHFFKYWY